MSFSNSALPIISITPYLSPSTDTESINLRKQTSAALHDACVKFGFFYLDISSYVSSNETDELMRLAREFFALPQDEKDRLSLKNEDNARGYARLHENVTAGKADNHEGLDFYRPVEQPDKSRPLWGTNQWPAVSGFQEKYQRWVLKMKKLGLIVMEAMALGLEMSTEEWNDLRSKVDDSFWVMRVIGYPPLPDDHDGISCGAHKDYGCLTFLHADSTPSALQVYLHGNSPMPLSGSASKSLLKGTWINADPIPGCVVCNIGEMWETWTNGLYKSTMHRVIHRGSNYRVSIPFFFEPNFDALVKPLPAAVRLLESHAEGRRSPEAEAAVPRKKYKPIIYGDFLLNKVGNNFSVGKGKYA